MKMQVVDQLHVSALGPETMKKGQEFEVSNDLGKDLERRGLATRIEDNANAGNQEKAEAAPLNKAEQPPDNKAEAPTKKSDRPTRAKRGKRR